MTDDKGVTQPTGEPDEEKDVEGHNMWINPTITSDMARNRSKDLEREARERNRAKEAKRS
jgi:hypothetical protein